MDATPVEPVKTPTEQQPAGPPEKPVDTSQSPQPDRLWAYRDDYPNPEMLP